MAMEFCGEGFLERRSPCLRRPPRDDPFVMTLAALRGAGLATAERAPALAQLERYGALPCAARMAVESLAFGNCSDEGMAADLRLRWRHEVSYRLGGLGVEGGALTLTLSESHTLHEVGDARREALDPRARVRQDAYARELRALRGGSSFRARLSGRRVIDCPVLDRTDGTYSVRCTLGGGGGGGDGVALEGLEGLVLSVRLDYTHFSAFALGPAYTPSGAHFENVVYRATLEPALLNVLHGCVITPLAGPERVGPSPALAEPTPATMRRCTMSDLLAAKPTWYRAAPSERGGRGTPGTLGWEGDAYRFRMGDCALDRAAEVAPACLAALNRRGGVTLMGASHMRFAWDALVAYAGGNNDLELKHESVNASSLGLRLKLVLFAHHVRSELASVAPGILQQGSLDADAGRGEAGSAAAGLFPSAAVVAQSGAWDVAACGIEAYVTRQLPSLLFAALHLARLADSMPDDRRALFETPTPFPGHVAEGNRAGRGGRNTHALAAAAELAREFHAFHKLPMLDSFDIHRPRSDFPADMGGHYIVPVRDEGSSEVRALVGPVGDAYVHVLLGALCAEDKS